MVEQLTTIAEIRAFLEIDDSVSGITAGDIANWNAAYGWGNHASAGYLTSETDPVYTASSWFGTTNNAGNWNTAFGWGNHASAGYLTALPAHTHPLSDLTQSGATSNQVPQWNGSAWVPVTISTSNIYTADGTLTGNRALTLDTYTFSIKKTTNTFFHVFNNGNVRVSTGTPVDDGYNLQVSGSIAGGLNAGGLAFVVPNGSAIRGTGTGATTIYIDSNNGLNGTIQYRATTHLFSGTITANAITGLTALSIANTNAVLQISGAGVQVFRIFNTASSADWRLENHRNAASGSLEINNTIGSSAPCVVLTPNRAMLIGTNTELTSALLNVTSTTKGFLKPRMTTTQKNAVASPATGLELYDTDLNSPEVYNGTAWHHKVIAPNSTKVTAGAPYTNDGYVEVKIAGVTFKLMTTA